MSLTSKIIPAPMPKSYEDLVSIINTLTGLPEVHVDVLDGKFVQATSWPYIHNDDVSVAYELLSPFSLEVDLMVEKPLVAAEAWLKAGADQLVFHIETIEAKALEHFTHAHSVTVGVALDNDTSLEKLHPYLPFVEYVQVMGIATIGAQGQPFDDRVIDRITSLQKAYPSMPISIDGSVNTKTISQLKNLGLQRFIVGSAIVSAENPKDAYRELTLMAQS
jgi:ribulose-phosphate 3-epimerase